MTNFQKHRVLRIMMGSRIREEWIYILWGCVNKHLRKHGKFIPDQQGYLDWLLGDGYADSPFRRNNDVPISYEDFILKLDAHYSNTMRRILLACPDLDGEWFEHCRIEAES